MKESSFKGSIGNIYQSFAGEDVYASLEEKAANLLYFVTKNHSFFDGNKRIAATMFLYFLDKNKALFIDGKKKLKILLHLFQKGKSQKLKHLNLHKKNSK